MSSGPHNQEFVFDTHFNSQYINELYDGDYVLIEETFADVLQEYGPLLQSVMVCYRSGDLPALRSAVHKIKPLLGYVGLTGLQEECQQFENNCQQDSFPSLHSDFVNLSAGLTTAKTRIESENTRLADFVRRMG